VSEMAPEPVLVWVCAWQEGGVVNHRYYDLPERAETQARGVTARCPAIKPLVYAQTVHPYPPDLEATA
jgi:hypothetical protein